MWLCAADKGTRSTSDCIGMAVRHMVVIMSGTH